MRVKIYKITLILYSLKFKPDIFKMLTIINMLISTSKSFLLHKKYLKKIKKSIKRKFNYPY